MRKVLIGIGLIILTGLVGSLMVLSPLPGYSQDKVDQKKIDEVIDKGVDFLLEGKQVEKWMKRQEIELVVLTLLHAGVNPKKNTWLANAIQKIAASKLEKTYNVAVTAMALELADRSRYQYRIAECAQALVNYQCKNGQWDYPSKYEPNQGQPKITGETAEPKEIITDQEVKPSTTKAMKKIIVKQTNPKRGEKGDNSNTQFALLGLRAAVRCGVEIPKETWEDAVKWLEKDQLASGGWTYTGILLPEDPRKPYGSMTCACLCGLTIAKFYLGQDIHKDALIDKGLNWLGANLRFTENPGGFIGKAPKFWHYYYIYGVERVGAVLGIEQIGSHEWYPEGVEYLLQAQKDDGSWNTPEDDAWSTVIADTCFAILFLKKATQKLTPKITGGE
jgi:hypothetical protein